MALPLRLLAAMFVLPWASLVMHAQQEDAHDKLVYGRYSRKLQASPIELQYPKTLPELDHPATPQDVAVGKAVFSFEGLGQACVWKLPECPFVATWPALKDYPSPEPSRETRYENYGIVCQAEELLVNGQWKRYFGFVGTHGATVVPAGEINVWFNIRGPSPGMAWIMLPGGTDWGIETPGWELSGGEAHVRAMELGKPVLVNVQLRNRRGSAQEVLGDLYHDAQHGGPAFREGVTLCLDWAPFDARNPDEDYPRSDHYMPVTAKREAAAAYDSTAAGKRLETGETHRAFTVNLCEWFKLEQPGYYKVRFEFDCDALGLPKEPKGPMDDTKGAPSISEAFTVGTPPRRPTVAEVNREIAPLGGTQNEARLVALIKETIGPAADRKRASAVSGDGLLAWADAVNGLTARVEFVDDQTGYEDWVVLVRLKNVSDHPLLVPTGNASDSGKLRAFELYAEKSGEDWQRMPWFDGEHLDTPGPPVDQGGRMYGADETGNRRDRPVISLKPHESALVYLCGEDPKRLRKAINLSVLLRQAEPGGKDVWHGALQTRAYPISTRRTLLETHPGSEPFPEHFPEFCHARTFGGNSPPHVAELERVRNSNWALMQVLELYEPAGVRAELERRMRAENDPTVKLLYAVLAARAGSEAAGLFLLAGMKQTDHHAIWNVLAALQILLGSCKDDPPDWILELVELALSDDRYVTELERPWSPGTIMKISCLADDAERLTRFLGWTKSPRVGPFLIELARRTKGTGDVLTALGDTRDARAIPVLLDLLKSGSAKASHTETGLSPGTYHRAVAALGDLKAKEAVPTLLAHIEFPQVIESLEQIGEARAVPALRELVAAKGQVRRQGAVILPELDGDRLFAAKLALAYLEEGDHLPAICAMLGDQTLGDFQRVTVARRLRQHPDPRAIPALLKAIKSDPSGSVADDAIWALSAYHCTAAVEGLLECFDCDFEARDGWKGASMPEELPESIAMALRKITGQTFGPDKERWLRWWRETGRHADDWK